jgi:hypothetical protein
MPFAPSTGPHPFGELVDSSEHVDESVVGVVESSPGFQVFVAVDHRDRVR